MIFLSVTGSFAAAVIYDRREKKAAQKKWCDAVSHFSTRTLGPRQMPRRLTIFLTAPPGDGIRPSRQYFKEYIKPVLVAAAMDYEVVEGRKEGDLRYETAEHFRQQRRKLGETSQVGEDAGDSEFVLDALREALDIRQEPGVKGDLVIGRHSWKEYIRGLHEGWLGPLDDPAPPILGASIADKVDISDASPTTPSTESTDSEQDKAQPEAPKTEEKAPSEDKKPPYPPPAFISTSAYTTSPPSPNLPTHFEPSSAIPHRHILGFLNTPTRIYRFLNQRTVADSVGRQTASIVFGLHRPYQQHHSDPSDTTQDASPTTRDTDSQPSETQGNGERGWEQQSLLQVEEAEWHKSARKPLKDEAERERVWTDDVVMDPRIAERMRVFELSAEDEERAKRIAMGLEKADGVLS